jgi:hypothetical protein
MKVVPQNIKIGKNVIIFHVALRITIPFFIQSQTHYFEREPPKCPYLITFLRCKPIVPVRPSLLRAVHNTAYYFTKIQTIKIEFYGETYFSIINYKLWF